jgi:hypothetical protein
MIKWRESKSKRALVVGGSALLVLASGARADDDDDMANDVYSESEEPQARSRVRTAGPLNGTHVLVDGETLWSISERYFGDGEAWPRLWSYNPEITNPHWIYPGTTVRLGDGSGDAPAPRSTTVRQAARVVRSTPDNAAVTLRDHAFLDAEALEQSGELVSAEMDHMFFLQFEEAYVQFSSDDPVRVGDELTLFRPIPQRERGENEEGELVRIFGTARVVSYDDGEKKARVRITEVLDPIERGMRVANVPRRFASAPARRNEQDLTGRVVGASRPTRVIGDGQVVFVNLGAEDGVRVGNRLFVVATEDRWAASGSGTMDRGNEISSSEENPALPPQVIAELRIVNVRPHSAAALVTRAVHEFEVGARTDMRSGY